MVSRDQKLINEIEAGALDENTPIPSVLRKCLVLGGRAGSAELRDWARREFHGYDKKIDIPSYRKVSAHIKIDTVIGYHRITGQIEEMTRPQNDDSDSVSLSPLAPRP